jgi:threonine/homoserine/homoserine lactone efflux protein
LHLDLWLAFVAAAVVLLAVPGPTILTVISYSASHGKRAALPLVVGVALGDSTALFLSLVGLGALLATSAFWFSVVKWAGGLYLLYLGIKMFRAAASPTAGTAAPARDSLWRLFVNTYAVTALNPKGIVFFVAFLPQFIHPGTPSAPQLWTLGFTFVILAALNAMLYATFVGAARRMLESPSTQRRFNLLGGSLICAAGTWALFAKRPAQ